MACARSGAARSSWKLVRLHPDQHNHAVAGTQSCARDDQAGCAHSSRRRREYLGRRPVQVRRVQRNPWPDHTEQPASWMVWVNAAIG